MKTDHTKKLFVFLFMGLVVLFAQSTILASESTTNADPKSDVAQGLEDEQETKEEIIITSKVNIKEPNLPIDTTARMTAKELVISGNTLISTKSILKKMPAIYNLSYKPVHEAPSSGLFDFRSIRNLIDEPNLPQEVSLRTIEGFLQYVLSLYQKKHYAGIYVYIPDGVILEGKELKDNILQIQVLEIPVNEVSVQFYRADQNDVNDVEKSYLRRSAVEKWSPVQPGEVMNEKELDDFVNLLNLNPDRHVYSIISEGNEPNTLALDYDIYEGNPWHYFIQVDNSGTNDRQWTPRMGFINTNLTGYDDRFTAVYQAKPDSTINDNYSIYGNYDVPVMGPKLRMNLYGGHSEFDIVPESGIFNFLGRGSFYGALLKYNLYQDKDWFLDITGSYSHERSKVTPSLFPSAGSDIDMDLVGIGAELSRSDDKSNTSVSANISMSIDGSSRDKFNLARTNSDPDFTIYTISASHSRYLDKEKYKQLRGTFRWIGSDERLVPAKMTSFGGMYSVRGYDEYEIVADGGILASIQYEFDWLRYISAVEPNEAEEDADISEEEEITENKTNNFELRKLSPLVFFDYGRASIKDPVIGEGDNYDLYSVGLGLSFELGKNLSGACYYGHPLKGTDDTREGKGRLSVSFMLRW